MRFDKKQSIYSYVENIVFNQEETINFNEIFNEIVNYDEFNEISPESLLDIVMTVFEELVNSGIIKERTSGVYFLVK